MPLVIETTDTLKTPTTRQSVAVIRQVLALKEQSLPELRQQWRQLFNEEAPSWPKASLLSPLAYRLQELAYGGLSDVRQRQLDQLTKALTQKKSLSATLKHYRKPSLVVGTRLIREFRGTAHEVLVAEDGFTYNGQSYRSLSAIARAITGSRWNGWVFFGLKKTSGGASDAND